MISGLSPERIDASLAYELNHIRRNDYTINSIRTLIETIFFFHPAIWYISPRSGRKERMHATIQQLNPVSALTSLPAGSPSTGGQAGPSSPDCHRDRLTTSSSQARFPAAPPVMACGEELN
ncbi:MAG: hypothetical protein JXB24_08780 [Bacteroidales bacterium]|nr:hypothetical protein [Bacteroidales bacterium]